MNNKNAKKIRRETAVQQREVLREVMRYTERNMQFSAEEIVHMLRMKLTFMERLGIALWLIFSPRPKSVRRAEPQTTQDGGSVG